jgi:hypothetical protein
MMHLLLLDCYIYIYIYIYIYNASKSAIIEPRDCAKMTKQIIGVSRKFSFFCKLDYHAAVWLFSTMDKITSLLKLIVFPTAQGK